MQISFDCLCPGVQEPGGRAWARKLKVNLHAGGRRAPAFKYTIITVRSWPAQIAAFIVVIIALSAALFRALSLYLIARA